MKIAHGIILGWVLWAAAAPRLAAPADASVNDRYIAVMAPVKGIDLAPRFAGELRRLYVDAGDRVKAGTLIADLDPRPLQEALTIAENVLQTTRAERREAQVDVTYAERVLAREQRAVARGVSAQQNLERVRFDLARVRAAYARVNASIKEQEMRVKQARHRLDDAQLHAPFTGVIAERYYDPGAAVGPHAPVVRLISDDTLRVRFAVPLSHAQRLRTGQRVSVDITQIDMPLNAVIRQIAPELDPASKLIFVEAELTVHRAATANLYPGAAAWVTLDKATAPLELHRD